MHSFTLSLNILCLTNQGHMYLIDRNTTASTTYLSINSANYALFKPLLVGYVRITTQRDKALPIECYFTHFF